MQWWSRQPSREHSILRAAPCNLAGLFSLPEQNRGIFEIVMEPGINLFMALPFFPFLACLPKLAYFVNVSFWSLFMSARGLCLSILLSGVPFTSATIEYTTKYDGTLIYLLIISCC